MKTVNDPWNVWIYTKLKFFLQVSTLLTPIRAISLRNSPMHSRSNILLSRDSSRYLHSRNGSAILGHIVLKRCIQKHVTASI